MATVEIFSAVIGAVVAGVLVTIAYEMRGKSTAPEWGKLTQAWRVSELREPLVVARDLTEIDLPAGCKIVASGLVDGAVFKACDVRQTAAITAEYAVDKDEEKAILWLAGARRGTMALVTINPEIVARLAADARAAWQKADPYVEMRAIRELAGRSGVRVQTRGTVQDALPYHGRYIMRLADEGSIIGVIVEKDPSGLVGQEVQVTGHLDKDDSGFPCIDAQDLRRLR